MFEEHFEHEHTVFLYAFNSKWFIVVEDITWMYEQLNLNKQRVVRQQMLSFGYLAQLIS